MTNLLLALMLSAAGLAIYWGTLHLVRAWGYWKRIKTVSAARQQRMLLEAAILNNSPLAGARLGQAFLTKEDYMPKKEPPVIYRQGDVLLVKVNDDDKWINRDRWKNITPKDRIVLAYGEVTGHAHAVYPEVDSVEMDGSEPGKPKLKAKLWDAGAERFLQVLEKTALRHEEHTTIPLEKGTYRVVRQREYDPERDRIVAD